MTILVDQVQYRCVLADPPWPEQGGGKCKRGADRHYSLLKPTDILRVMLQAAVWRPDPAGCHLWLWVTNNYLPDGLWLLGALGFRYITNFAWAKMNEVLQLDVPAGCWRRQRAGLGQYSRGAHELLLFGVRGRLAAVAKWPTLILGPRSAVHSQKPDVAYSLIEGTSPGPRLEMFARQQRPGWTSWGNEV